METIKGYLRYEPEMRFTVMGTALTKFTLYDTSEKAYDNKQVVICWEQLAEEANKKLALEDLIYAKGYYKERSWETPEGETRVVKEFTAKQLWISEDGIMKEVITKDFRETW
jgi:single-stranded DNA-binding protein